MDSTSTMLEIPEVAELLGVKETTLWTWRSKKINIPFYRISTKRVLYRLEDVNAYIENCRVETSGTKAPGGRC